MFVTLSLFFAGLAPFIWHFAVVLFAIALCLIRAYFKAAARKTYACIIVVLLLILAAYIVGAKNAENRCVQQETVVHTVVHDAVHNAISVRPQADRYDADHKPLSGLRSSRWPNPLRLSKFRKPDLRSESSGAGTR